ncbi:MAG TPA: LURP-one-related family protein [Candidatus Dormibacteraeota bacterium]|nr:LURP-one-related family protein [Candidatus Dormibacteraeota bacterium]
MPGGFAEEHPNPKDMATQILGMVGGGFQQQADFRAHYQQLASFAKCPQCGAASFTQEKVAESAAPPEPTASQASSPETSPAPVPMSASSPTPATQPQTYVLNEKLVSLTGDLWIEDGSGNHMFEVDGQLLSLRGTHVLKDLNGRPLYEISKPLAPHLHRTIEIKQAGQTVATVQEALFNLGGDKFTITLAAGQSLTVRGDWMSREFQVMDAAGAVVMTASRAWFSIRGAYGIQISPGFDVAFGLAIAVALERVEAEQSGNQSPLQNLLGGFGSL